MSRINYFFQITIVLITWILKTICMRVDNCKALQQKRTRGGEEPSQMKRKLLKFLHWMERKVLKHLHFWTKLRSDSYIYFRQIFHLCRFSSVWLILILWRIIWNISIDIAIGFLRVLFFWGGSYSHLKENTVKTTQN